MINGRVERVIFSFPGQQIKLVAELRDFIRSRLLEGLRYSSTIYQPPRMTKIMSASLVGESRRQD